MTDIPALAARIEALYELPAAEAAAGRDEVEEAIRLLPSAATRAGSPTSG